jgi:hypothetical protein
MFLVLPAMNADYRPTLGSFFCVFQPRMVALLSVPATQGPLEEMDLELHKIAYSSISIKGEPYDHPLDDWYFRSWTLL